MTTKNPLEIPEILAQIGKHIPMWTPTAFEDYSFHPRDMFSCVLVSRNFRKTLLPILWYTFDERSMSTVPVDIIRKYTPYFRVHYNYGYRQQNYPTNNRESCTGLIELTIAWEYGFLDWNYTEYIKKNPGLRLLEGKFNAVHTDVFSNLRQLNHLRIHLEDKDQESHRQLLQPISNTLESLRISSDVGPLGLRGLVFPNLKELEPNLPHAQDLQDLLQGCPHLEAIIDDSSPMRCTHLIDCLKAEVCPALKSLRSNVYYDLVEDFAEVFESRSGLQDLQLHLVTSNARFVNAINHHASSLTRLSIQQMETGSIRVVPFVLKIIGICGRLKDVSVGGLNKAIDSLISKDNWRNVDALESLTLQGRTMSLHGNDIRMSKRVVTRSNLSELPINDWKRSPGTRTGLNTMYLISLFQIVQGFSSLRTVTVNTEVFKRV
ncbi:hypothetical protein BGZ65_002544 [Modicella reniformis]|uniref:Uncharacterized protein n=1 Tax=Modicella reniformis TaxID=1440133 RepID=A0A9P6J0P3_9FUNG|nr:hypothetical protein BGZ65_002544 [Modicella reniformis]